MASFVAEAEKTLKAGGAAPASKTVGYKKMEDLTPLQQEEYTQRNIILYLLNNLTKRFDELGINKEKMQDMHQAATDQSRKITSIEGNIQGLQIDINKVRQEMDQLAKQMAKDKKEMIDAIKGARSSTNISSTDVDRLAEKLGGMVITEKQDYVFFTEKDY